MEEVKHIYKIKVDSDCPKCGIRNYLDIELDEPMDVIACGNCGEFLANPESLSKEDKHIVKCLIDKSLGREDALL
jgi:transcription elongation factor Elf1